MSTKTIKKIDSVKYKANDYRVDKKGKRTQSKFSFWVRAGGQWTTAAESGDERAEKFRGVFSADVAALKLPEIIEACGLEASDGVRRAAEEAEARLNEILRKREAREDAMVERGRTVYLAEKSTSAIKAWDRLRERVEARAKANAAIIDSAATAEKSTSAIKAWDRIKENVRARAKAAAAIIDSAADAENDDSAADAETAEA